MKLVIAATAALTTLAGTGMTVAHADTTPSVTITISDSCINGAPDSPIAIATCEACVIATTRNMPSQIPINVVQACLPIPVNTGLVPQLPPITIPPSIPPIEIVPVI